MPHPLARKRALRPVIAVLLSVAGAAAAAPAPSPLALACTGCHQAAVDSAEMPSLAALSAAAIEAALKAARDRPRAGSIMARFVATMSDAEIAQLASELGRADSARTP